MKLTHCHTIITPTNPTNSSVHSNLSTCTSSNGIENFNNVSNYESQSKVTSLCYSADNTKLAIATADRAISIYNNQGERVDKFNTKANSNGPKDYIIRSIQFGPDVDNPKLAIAQSDAIVFVYKWKRREGTHSGVPCTNTYTHVDGNRDSENGGEMNASIITATNNPARSSNAWNGKKSICNKFIEESAVTSLIWPRKHPHQIVYGLLEGKVKIGNLRSNKSKTLYNIDSNVVVSLTSNLDGTELLSGHTDGSIYRFVFPTKTKSSSCTKIIHYSSPPSVLSWGRSICVSGMNDKVVFYNDHGDEEQTFSYNDQDGKIGPSALDVFRSSDFTTSCCSPNGDSIVVGSFDCFYLYCWNVSKRSWEENITHAIQHMYSVTAIDWKSDGTSLVLGTSSGLVDKYDAAYRQFVYKDSFVITYVSPSQVLICDKDEANSRPVLIQSSRGEITKLKIYHEPGTSIYRYIVARTKKSLLLYDIESFDDSVTEISWRSNEKLKEKFIFDASNACIISNAGELSVVEYGKDEILGTVRTEYTSSYLLSLRINEHESSSNRQPIKGHCNNKTIAYLLDRQTICVKDLINMTHCTVNHKIAIDFLELNTRGNIVVFRDKKRNLNLFDAISQTKIVILSCCGYAQWVPDSDVLTAQSRNKMCVWYNVNVINQVSTCNIKGEIEGIERIDGKTEVIVDEEGVQVAYALSEELICFTSALQKKELKTCVGILETMSKSSQSQTMWQELQEISLKNWNLPIAERCAAALGNISEARYLRKVLKIASKSNINGGINDNDWEVRAKILQLNKEFTEAERIYLSHNRIDDAILMYENLTLFVDALRIAETTNHPDFEAKKDSYFQWLLENNQEEKAAQIKESYGDNIRAISIYLDAGFPGKAAHLIHDKDIVHPQHLLESVAAALIDAELLKESGKIYERMGQFQKALSYYTEGLSFREALNLAMSRIPSKVVAIEELWGDHLFLSGHYALSIDHFVDAHVLPKAIEAAISAQMWDRASEMIRRLDDSSPNTLGKIASKFVAVRRFEDAKVLFLKAGMNRSVILMYIQNGLWDKLSEEAIDLLTEDELYNIYSKEAERMVNDDKLNEAEKLYLLLNRPQEAIEVWKRAGRYDEALALVSSHCYDLYEETNQFVAKEKEKCGQLNEAESFYVASGDWLGAVEMYRTRDMWDDAIRVAKLSMEKEILDRVAYDYSIHLGEKAHEVLSNLDIFSNAIRFAVNSEEFENALDLASNMGSEKMLGGIHLKFAHSLEHDGKYEEAANEYIKAGNISDAIDMYIHLRGWNDAEKIARVHNPNYLNAIHMAHAEDAVQSKDFVTAERCFITAGEAEKALLMYRKNELWKDALRVAQEHVPRLSDQLQISLEESMNQRQNETSKACFIHNARALEEAERFDEAIDAYLRPQSNSSLDPLDLEDLWDNAIRLVNERCPQRIQTVSKDVASRLCQVGLLLKAAEVLSQSDQVGSAVEILIEAKHWEQAKVYAHGHPHLTKSFINAYEKWLVDNGDYNELLLLGQTKTAFDMMMNNGDWDSIWETLHNQKELNPGSFVQYTVIRINELLQNCDIPNILSILAMILEQMAPLPDYQIHFDLYLRITQKILCFDKDTEESCDYCTMLKKLKSVLLLTLEKYKSNSQHDMEVTASFIHLLMTVHYSFVMELCTKNNLLVIACKCSLTLLRYSVLEKGDGDIHTLIPADKIFYKAGILCKEICNERLTFMMLNRYVDILEAMEENDFTDFAHDDFERTNIPCDTNHPSVHYISSEERREEIRDWVLGACIDSTIERSLPLPEDAIRGELHEGLYENDRDQCIVTGYPIPDGKLLTMETCKCNKDDWDSFFNTFDFHPWSVREG